jgi:hypothetical protein
LVPGGNADTVHGVMFINYRSSHRFSDGEREIITALADWFGFAPGTQRHTQGYSEEMIRRGNSLTEMLLM